MRSITRPWLELLSSMRFAISLLTIIAVASVIGTVMKQNEPYANYLNQFGPFWFPVFERIGLYSVYNAWWFLLILAFLVASTSLCVTRNGPKMMREVVRFRDHVHERSLGNLPHTAAFSSALAQPVLVERFTGYLTRERFQYRVTEKAGGATLIAAKAGLYRRIGYILAHSAIVLICIGGLADSAILLKLQVMLGIKQPVTGNMLIADVPAEARLSPDSWNFRGNTLIPEGRSSDIVVLNYGEGILLQQLPYTLSLKKFHIEHYSTGAPKLFASDVLVTDKESGESFEARIEVNRPLIYKGIAAYQASFDDGGTQIRIALRNLLMGRGVLRELEARVGDSLELKLEDSPYSVEFTAFRPFNIENVGAPEARPERSGTERLKEQFGSAAP
jgi:cytochrome c biogenesis protein